MRLLDKVRAAGYKVTETTNKHGVRFITIHGGGAWTRIVLKPWGNRLPIARELVRRCNAYIANPLTC